MLNETDQNKVRGFVDHLFTIPNIKNEPILIAESLILNFIVQNLDQLKATFSTPQFFPELPWNSVLQFILSDIYGRVEKEISPMFMEYINTGSFEAINRMDETLAFPNDFHREKLGEFFLSAFRNKDYRYNLNSVVNIFNHGIIEKYITEIFRRREFLYNEIVRVQKTYIECEDYITVMKVMLLVKNAAYIKISFPQAGGGRYNLNDTLRVPGRLPKFIDAAVSGIRQQAPGIPEKCVRLSLKANLKNSMTELEDASSRLIYILSARFHNYSPVTSVDRGAESPDKSWFSIARKNADHYGFDRRMLEALYRLAGDNNW